MSLRRRAPTACGLALACAFAGCAPQPATEKWNVLFLVVDALRPDHLGAGGYPRATSPALDALAARGAWFDAAYAASFFTRASVPSIFTGSYPALHRVLEKRDVLSDNFRTLAELLGEAGYATAAFMPNPNLRRTFNFDQGFELYDDEIPVLGEELPPHERFETAKRIHERALGFLEGIGERPYFLYLHYRDVHGPYVAPPEYQRLFWDPERDAERPGARRLDERERAALPPYFGDSPYHDLLDYHLAMYDAEIRYTDDRIAELLERLGELGLLERTLVVVTADHGEAFFEHSQVEHGQSLFEEEMRVPLIVIHPRGLGAGLRVATPVSAVDLLPTVLELVGAGEPPEHAEGRSLVPLLRGEPAPERPLFAIGRLGWWAVWQGRWKLVNGHGWRQPMLFDLAADPGETRDLFATEGARAAEMDRTLRDWLRRTRERWGPYAPGRHRPSQEAERELRALGYL